MTRDKNGRVDTHELEPLADGGPVRIGLGPSVVDRCEDCVVRSFPQRAAEGGP